MNTQTYRAAADGPAFGDRVTTRWSNVAVIVLLGVLGAFQLGKVAIALPTLRHDLQISLVVGSLALSMFGIVGASFGLLTGGIARSWGPHRVAIGGVLLCCAGSLAGSDADGGVAFLATRLIEALGYMCIQVSVPAMLALCTARRDRWIAFALAGAYVPIGQAIVILASPSILSDWGWRGLWLVNGGLLALAMAAFVLVIDQDVERKARQLPQGRELIASARDAWGAAGPRFLGAIFSLYAFQWIAVIGFLPTLYTSRGIPLGRAGALTAAVVAVNVLGNLTGGVLARRGMAHSTVLIAGSCMMAACGAGIFAPGLPFGVTYGFAVIFSAVGGLLPSTVLVTLPDFVETAHDLPAVNGLVVQCQQFGSASGPFILAAFVSATGGWTACGPLLCVAALAAVALGLRFRSIERWSLTSAG
jgi:cyanate permease